METILQVEDDPNDVVFLRHSMKKAGMTNPVQVVDDGQQAIDYLKGRGKFADRKQFPLPQLVLLDLKLPYVMGLDVLKWIRENIRIPVIVIVMTASAENADMAMAYRLGANAFLTKPSEAGKLDEMVRAIKDFWLTHNKMPYEPDNPRTVAPGRRPILDHPQMLYRAKPARRISDLAVDLRMDFRLRRAKANTKDTTPA